MSGAFDLIAWEVRAVLYRLQAAGVLQGISTQRIARLEAELLALSHRIHAHARQTTAQAAAQATCGR